MTFVTLDHNNEKNVGALSSTQSGVSCWPFIFRYQQDAQSFPGSTMIKNPPTSAGALGSIPGMGRSPGVGNGTPLQYSCLGDPLVREAWWSMGRKASDTAEHTHISRTGLPWRLRGKEPTCQGRRCRLHPWVGEIPWRKQWQPTAVFLPGKSHGQRSWRAIVPGVTKDSDTS